MKKVAFILASLLVIMFAGCSEGSSSSGVSDLGDSTTNIETSTNDELTEVNAEINGVTGISGLTDFPAVPALPES